MVWRLKYVAVCRQCKGKYLHLPCANFKEGQCGIDGKECDAEMRRLQ